MWYVIEAFVAELLRPRGTKRGRKAVNSAEQKRISGTKRGQQTHKLTPDTGSTLVSTILALLYFIEVLVPTV